MKNFFFRIGSRTNIVGFNCCLSAVILCFILLCACGSAQDILTTVKSSERDGSKPVISEEKPKSSEQNGVKGRSEPSPLECPPKVNPADCERDRLGIEAIRHLHVQLDDDHNGNVDQSESDEFLRDELQYTDGFERQALFHNNDKLISVDDLWMAWKYSKVYNWTSEEVIEWLAQDVELPMYVESFNVNKVDGSFLPRLVNSTGALLASLGIRNPVHKRKLSLKAMDTVLFGAPKRVHSFTKDLLMVIMIILSFGGCWFMCLHHRYSQTQVKKMEQELEKLQKAEDDLRKLHMEIDEAEKNQKSMSQDKQVEMRMQRQNSLRLNVPISRHSGDRSPLSRDGSVQRREVEKKVKEGERKMKEAEEELGSLREALAEAESKLSMHQQMGASWTAPGEMQAWLQLTYEIESEHFLVKKQLADGRLLAARESCEKVKKRSQAFLGSLRMAHSNSMDNVDQSMLDARAALEEMKIVYQERQNRWQTMEMLCGFSIITNPGLVALRQGLGIATGLPNGRLPPGINVMNGASMSIEEADEDNQPAGFGYRKYGSSMESLLSSPHMYHATFPAFSLPPTHPSTLPLSTSKSFLKSAANQGSTGSLHHPKVLGTHLGPPGLAQGNPVAFHLGEMHNKSHERSNSNASLAGAGSNGHHVNHYGAHHAAGHNGHFGPRTPTDSPRSPTAFPPPMSYSPNNYRRYLTVPSNGSNSQGPQSHTSSTASLGSNKAYKAATHGNGSHLQQLSEEQQEYNNGQHMSTLASTPMVNSHSSYAASRLDDSDGLSLDSIPRSHSTSQIQRNRMEQAQEFDLDNTSNDNSSVHSRLSFPHPIETKKGSRKKKFLSKFMPGKSKIKTT